MSETSRCDGDRRRRLPTRSTSQPPIATAVGTIPIAFCATSQPVCARDGFPSCEYDQSKTPYQSPQMSAYVWSHAEVSIIVAEDQEQIDKVVALRDQLPGLRWVIYDDPRGMLHYRQDWMKSFADVEAAGREFAGTHGGYFEAIRRDAR